MKNKIAIGDADSLVALAFKSDAHHNTARKISEGLLARGYQIVYPNTAILEAIIALKRSLNLVEEAHLINRQYLEGAFNVEYVDEKLQSQASKRFEKTISKKNTIFDAIVAETAVLLGAEYIFSFDTWYPKQGFTLAG